MEDTKLYLQTNSGEEPETESEEEEEEEVPLWS
jgi:hypothetical protein